MLCETEQARQFRYEARDLKGALSSGVVAAGDREEAGLQLSERGLFVVRISESASAGNTGGAPHARRSEMTWQIWQLAVMIEGGIGLSEALACLARHARRPPLRNLLEAVTRHVEEGRALSEALAEHPGSFPRSLVAMIRASELNGTLTTVLRRCSLYLIKDLEVLRKVQSAMIYPILMLAMCLGVSGFLLVFVLPKFAQVFAARGAALPAPTRMLMGFSNALVEHWYVWVGAAAVSTAVGILWARSESGRRRLDWIAVTVPPFAVLFNALHQSRAFRALAMLIDSRAPLIDSIRVVSDIVPNVHYRELWLEVEEQVRVGERIGRPFMDSEFVEEAVAQMVECGDRSGQLGLAFSRLAEFMDQRYEHALGAVIKLLEPIMILIMGLVVGFVVLAMLLPLFQAAGVVSGT